MNVKTVKKTEPRIDINDISNLGIIGYGYNNTYPNDVRSIIACSETGMGCLDRYIDFIQGNGFKNVDFSEYEVNGQGDTPDDILKHISNDMGCYNGFAIHVNYNILAEITSISHVPFENCRLCQEDENGYVHKIAVFSDWTGKKKRGGVILRPTKENIEQIDIFNPKKEAVFSQIESAGGIEQYKGQILWISAAGKQEYPLPIYDRVITHLSTEEGLGNIALRNVRNNFLPSGYFIYRKGQDTPEGKKSDESIEESLSQVQSDENTGVILCVGVDFDEEIPKFQPFEGRNYDKDFTVTSDKVEEKIYASFRQEIWHRLRKGSVGFASDIVRDAYDVYSSETGTQRRVVERAFDKIFKHWHEDVSYMFENGVKDFTVQPLKYISNETPDNN